MKQFIRTRGRIGKQWQMRPIQLIEKLEIRLDKLEIKSNQITDKINDMNIMLINTSDEINDMNIMLIDTSNTMNQMSDKIENLDQRIGKLESYYVNDCIIFTYNLQKNTE